MGYVERSLISGESLVYRTRLHWNVLIKPVIWGGIPLGAGCAVLTSRYAVAAWALIPLGALLLVFAFINYFSSEFGVTNKRVLIKTGFMAQIPATEGRYDIKNETTGTQILAGSTLAQAGVTDGTRLRLMPTYNGAQTTREAS